jgi:hypothetical protein
MTSSEFLALFSSFTVASYTLKTNSFHFYQTETTLFRIIQFPDTPAFHRLVNYPFHRSEILKFSIPSYTTVFSEFCILRKVYELQDTLHSLVYYLLRSCAGKRNSLNILQTKRLLLMLAITKAALAELHCYTDTDNRPLIILHENVTTYIQRKTKPRNIT